MSGEQWGIESGGHRATVVEVGGGIREYAVDGEPVLDGYPTESICPGGAGAQLAPWPNRTGDGKYGFGGGEYQLALSEPAKRNAIHGLVRWMPWRRIGGTPDSVTVACALPAHPGYPWPLSLTTRWTVSQHGLRVEHTATNLGDTPAPYGLGCHPYLTLPGAVDDWVLRVPARTVLRTDERSLPVAEEPVAGTEWDFGVARRIGGAVLDTAYTDLVRGDAGTADVELSTVDGRRVTLWADESFRWVQVFTADTAKPPRTRRSVAVEPMTCPPDALRTGRDLITLDPGDTWRGAWGLRVTT
ncbi:MAG TPA: aldose 1-epimerase family protein [Actinocatenispora sp.]